MSYLVAAEAVSMGHPDKICDKISENIFIAHLIQDPETKSGLEVLATTGLCVIAGEITSNAVVDIESVVKQTLRDIGYDEDAETIEVLNKIRKQSLEINSAVNRSDGEIGAGDQGIMYAWASGREAPNYMGMAHYLAFELIKQHEKSIAEAAVYARGESIRLNKYVKSNSPFRPDCKTEVVVEYENKKVKRVHTVLVSTSHIENLTQGDIIGLVCDKIIGPVREAHRELFDEKTNYIINPSGSFTVCGIAGDSGVAGKKLSVDFYSGYCPLGGGSLSGKDNSKVDRSASYMMRYLAKNIVAANLAEEATLQVSYAIGLPEPLSFRVDTSGTGTTSDENLTEMVLNLVKLTPKAIIDRLDLKNPSVLAMTASGGHFGNPKYRWEQLDLVDIFKEYAKKWASNKD